MENIVFLIVLIAIAALLIWSGVHACRIQNRFLKWGGVGFAAVLAVVVSNLSSAACAANYDRRPRNFPLIVASALTIAEELC
jgi:hypothetical protein